MTIVMIKLLEFFMLEEYGSNAVTNPISWWRPLLHPQELGIGQQLGELVHRVRHLAVHLKVVDDHDLRSNHDPTMINIDQEHKIENMYYFSN